MWDGRLATGEQAAAENDQDTEDGESFHSRRSVCAETKNCKRLNPTAGW